MFFLQLKHHINFTFSIYFYITIQYFYYTLWNIFQNIYNTIQRSFTNSRISVIRWELLLSSKSIYNTSIYRLFFFQLKHHISFTFSVYFLYNNSVYNNSIFLLHPIEYLSKYLQRSFANSRTIIRWKLLLSSKPIRKTKFFPDRVTLFENRFVHHRERKLFHPSTSFLPIWYSSLFARSRRLSTHTHTQIIFSNRDNDCLNFSIDPRTESRRNDFLFVRTKRMTLTKEARPTNKSVFNSRGTYRVLLTLSQRRINPSASREF